MSKYSFHVNNMNCEGCVTNIRKALEESPQIENHNIQLNDKSVTLETELSEQSAASIIIEAGYEAKPAKEKAGFLKRLIGSQ